MIIMASRENPKLKKYFGEEEIRDFEDNLYNARNEDIDGDLI